MAALTTPPAGPDRIALDPINLHMQIGTQHTTLIIQQKLVT